MKRILVIEPYYGGSHKQFLDGLSRSIDVEWVFLTLPARKWKMRMQLSAPWFVSCVKKMENVHFDTVLCSTFIDVAVFKALLPGITGWNSECRICTYFHENQFAYPTQVDDKSQFQFTAINFTTALASNSLAFNSSYNWHTFFQGCRQYINKAADISLQQCLVEIEEKSTILYPGQEFEDQLGGDKEYNSAPVICWNHRWEHDKDPEAFFDALYVLEDQGYDFKIMLLGQSFRDIPLCFSKAKEHFGKRILHYGFVESKKEYSRLLQQCDIAVSTARHEFFGISMLEAVQAGCIPVVPDRLSYPELYPKKFRYTDGTLVDKLTYCIKGVAKDPALHCTIDTNRFQWKVLAKSYQKWLFGPEC